MLTNEMLAVSKQITDKEWDVIDIEVGINDAEIITERMFIPAEKRAEAARRIEAMNMAIASEIRSCKERLDELENGPVWAR